MKRTYLIPAALAMGIMQPVRTNAALSGYTPAIICASGTAVSTATALWAHYKIKKLKKLSNREKSNPEFKKNLAWWETVRTGSSTVAGMLAGVTAIMVYKQSSISHLKKAAQKASNTCGICYNTINDPSQYAVGSPSSTCSHFYCINCITKWRATGRSMAKLCPECRQA